MGWTHKPLTSIMLKVAKVDVELIASLPVHCTRLQVYRTSLVRGFCRLLYRLVDLGLSLVASMYPLKIRESIELYREAKEVPL